MCIISALLIWASGVIYRFKPVLRQPTSKAEENDDQVYQEKKHGEIKLPVEV